MEESEYHLKADLELDRLLEFLEDLENHHDISPELESGVLSIVMPDDKEYVINKHTPSRQIWVSSPYSGASYFEYIDKGWHLKRATTEIENKDLYNFITQEVKVKLD